MPSSNTSPAGTTSTARWGVATAASSNLRFISYQASGESSGPVFFGQVKNVEFQNNLTLIRPAFSWSHPWFLETVSQEMPYQALVPPYRPQQPRFRLKKPWTQSDPEPWRFKGFQELTSLCGSRSWISRSQFKLHFSRPQNGDRQIPPLSREVPPQTRQVPPLIFWGLPENGLFWGWPEHVIFYAWTFWLVYSCIKMLTHELYFMT